MTRSRGCKYWHAGCAGQDSLVALIIQHVPELEVAERGGEHTEALARLLELHALGDRLLGFRLRHAAGVSGLSGLSGGSIARRQQAMCEERAEARFVELQMAASVAHNSGKVACHTERVNSLEVGDDAVVELFFPQAQLGRLLLAGAE
eukprot:SM000076S21817  [mRNA]  locus=s76:327434:328860:- [translate_table: standard]